jgi:hypothetical protein
MPRYRCFIDLRQNPVLSICHYLLLLLFKKLSGHRKGESFVVSSSFEAEFFLELDRLRDAGAYFEKYFNWKVKIAPGVLLKLKRGFGHLYSWDRVGAMHHKLYLIHKLRDLILPVKVIILKFKVGLPDVFKCSPTPVFRRIWVYPMRVSIDKPDLNISLGELICLLQDIVLFFILFGFSLLNLCL